MTSGGSPTGKVFAYCIEGDAVRSFMDMRLRAVEDHLVFSGDHREGEFCQRFPATGLQLRGLYSIDDNVMSVVLTELPEGHPPEAVQGLFQQLVDSSRRVGGT